MKADLFAMIDSNGPQTGWIKWVEKWSKLSVNDFLRSRIGAEPICIYRPWPGIAIRGFQVYFTIELITACGLNFCLIKNKRFIMENVNFKFNI